MILGDLIRKVNAAGVVPVPSSPYRGVKLTCLWERIARIKVFGFYDMIIDLTDRLWVDRRSGCGHKVGELFSEVVGEIWEQNWGIELMEFRRMSLKRKVVN